MTREERKAREVVITIKMVLGFVIAILMMYGLTKGILMSIFDTTTPTTVIDCRYVDNTNYYEVTVQTDNGEQYAYYDDDYREIGDVLGVQFENDTITDVKE